MNELDRIKERVLSAISNNGGSLSALEFDDMFSSFTIKEGKRIRTKHLAFPPIWFVCANTDKSHAFHLHATQELMLEGKVEYNNDKYCTQNPVNLDRLLSVKPNLVKSFL